MPSVAKFQTFPPHTTTIQLKGYNISDKFYSLSKYHLCIGQNFERKNNLHMKQLTIEEIMYFWKIIKFLNFVQNLEGESVGFR